MRVHPSNFRAVGFTEDADLRALGELAAHHGIALVDDIGSGVLAHGPGPVAGLLASEPAAADSVAAGASVVCFSADKLLGGPQAGIAAGTAAALAAMRTHPLARAVRIDKLSLTALEATLRLHLEPARAAVRSRCCRCWPPTSRTCSRPPSGCMTGSPPVHRLGRPCVSCGRWRGRVVAPPAGGARGPAVAVAPSAGSDALAAQLRGGDPRSWRACTRARCSSIRARSPTSRSSSSCAAYARPCARSHDPGPLTLGTAGHIDHGKTALVRALTGVDTDRLPQERERGISIELGFAPLELPSGRQMSVVDVPGHERFVRTMVAGASGIDLFLLVVAGDDGVMPQTREHLAVLELLEVAAGVVAITKCDAVDAEQLELARADVAEVLADGPFAATPVLAVSAVQRRRAGRAACRARRGGGARAGP